MDKFISTKLFLALQDASQKGIDKDAKVLRNGYDEFAISVFQGRTVFTDKAAYHDALVYSRVELTTLPEIAGKKYGSLSLQGYRTHRRANRMGRKTTAGVTECIAFPGGKRAVAAEMDGQCCRMGRVDICSLLCKAHQRR